MLQKILFFMAILTSASGSAQALDSDADPRAGKLVQSYCVSCHNEALRTAGLLLDKADIGRVDQHAATFEKVVRRLRARSMPPQGMPRPNEDDYRFLIGHLESELDRAAIANPNPGRPVPHRLNRAEYANAVRDILELEINVEQLLPTDAASGHGFDNMADVLTLSPVLMERYLSAARTISRLAVGDPDYPSAIETYLIPANFEQLDRVSDELPFATRGGTAVSHYFPVDGEYEIRIQLKTIDVGIYAGMIVGFTKPKQLEVRVDGEKVGQFGVGGENASENKLTLSLPVKAGRHSVGITFLRDRAKAELIARDRKDGSVGDGGVSLVEIEGPLKLTGIGETPSRQKIFSCRPKNTRDESPCAEEIISNLTQLAYRRPLMKNDVDPLVALYQSARQQGGFDAAIAMAIQGILISPEFLFRVERDPANIKPGSAYAINDLDLASRLSFFLWSSVPDEVLLDLAAKGKLKDPKVLAGQVQRMIQDPRSKSVVENFASQWLHVRNLDLLSPPDPEVFPKYTHNLKTAFKKEIELLFDYVIREDRSILDFLNADYTFLNEQLAEHYGISGVHGSHFRRVSLTDESRWGLLGKGSVLTVTSYATRTSPTLRGKWVLENILGTPPPPPPPDVPSLKEDPQMKKLSMRERMEMHRSNSVCASCHSLMDPLGLALENFDAIGSYRKVNSDQTPIDASGVLPNGTEFNGPAQLRDALWQGREQFAGTFVERILTYALGRGLEYYDMPAVRKIMREASKEDYRWSSIVMHVVESQPFKMRRSKGP
jgi:cytochrome c5